MRDPAPVMLKCQTCLGSFQFGPHRYWGKVIASYQFQVCNRCFSGNHDGW